MSSDTGSSAASSSEGIPAAAAPRRPLAAVWLILAAATCWGTTATLARHLFRNLELPALLVVEWRLLIASLLLGAWLALRAPDRLRVRRADWGYVLVLALGGVAPVQGTYYYSIATLGVATAILLQYLAPSLIVLWQMARGAPVRAATLGAVAIAVTGTALLVGVGRDTLAGVSPFDLTIGFASAVIFAFYVIYSKRGLERYHPSTMLFYSFLLSALFWAMFHPPANLFRLGAPPEALLGVLALGVFSTLVPFSFFYAGLRRLPPAEAGVLATFEPVVAVISAWVVLGETLVPGQWLGAMLILVASLLATHAARRTPRTGPR